MNNPIITKQVEVNRFEFEHSLCFDTDLSRIYYDEFISELGNNFNQINDDYIVIGDASIPYFKWSEIRAMSKQTMLDIVGDILGWGYDNMTRLELEQEIRGISTLDYITYANAYLLSSWRDIVDYTFIAHGSSQGEAVKVLVIGKEYSHITCEHIENLFYDVPVSGVITIHDNLENESYELYVDEYLENAYEYDKDELIKSITDCRYNKTQNYYDALVEWINENLPEYLDYK